MFLTAAPDRVRWLEIAFWKQGLCTNALRQLLSWAIEPVHIKGSGQ